MLQKNKMKESFEIILREGEGGGGRAQWENVTTDGWVGTFV